MNNDGALATGMTGESMFANNQLDEPTKEASSEQNREFIDMLPTAEKELATLDVELSRINTLTDFFSELAGISTRMDESDYRSKLLARYGYVNYLLGRRATILNALEQGGKDMQKYELLPPAFTVPAKVEVMQDPRPYGWRAIVCGLRDLLGRKPM